MRAALAREAAGVIDLGLSAADRAAFEAALLAARRDISVRVTVLDRDEEALTELLPRVLTGSVQVDADVDVSRSLSMTLLDPGNKLQFDSGNPAEGAVYADNHLAVEYGVWVAALSRWVYVPVFSGPVTGFERDGQVVTVEAQGKESLGLDPHRVTAGYTLLKGRTLADAIAAVMGRLGEEKTRLGMVKGKLATRRAVTPGEQPWAVCVGGEEDASGKPKPGLMSKADDVFYLFYDGTGTLTAKRRGGPTSWVFDEAQLTSTPKYSYDVLQFVNHAEVKGGVRKGSKKHAHGEYTLPATHPLSPAKLGRNGTKRYMTLFHEADTLKTDADCDAKARQLVESRAFQGVAASFDCLPIPHLEDTDVVRLDLTGYTITFPLRQFTIPLTSDATMAVGFNKRVRKPRRSQ